MNAFTLYCILMLDSIGIALIILTGIFLIGTLGCGMLYCEGVIEDVKKARKLLKSFLICFFIAFTLKTFLPDTKQAATIYILPKLATPAAFDALNNEGKELYGIFKEWAKKELAEKENKQEAD
jgi:hypothetical protein